MIADQIGKNYQVGEVVIPALRGVSFEIEPSSFVSKILQMFVLEGFCLGIAGALIGNIAGGGLIFILNMVKLTYDFGRDKGIVLQASISPADILVISATVVIVSVIASLQPAFKASRMEPIKALRHV